MLISKKWLDTYVDALPSMEEIADTLLLHSFEIEGMEKAEDDSVLDIDVLPNRAHDCLCHEGVAKELSGILGLPFKKQEERFDRIPDSRESDFSQGVVLENKTQCKRYIATPVKNIEVRKSPQWLVSRLRAMGQKSINNLVDATNYILFDQGQPMHIFDADKVEGKIIVRNAREGEKMITLTNEEIELKESDLVIADEEKILALAGIKGGKAAEVDEKTKNIIVESANFDPVSVRKTARRVKILTDASKRYENGISSEKAMTATRSILSLIFELAGTENTLFGKATDLYPQFEEEYQLSFTREKTAKVLGFDIQDGDIQRILNDFSYTYVFHDGVYTVRIPFERLDLRIPEDMIEEIGRIYGYHNIPVKSVEEIDSDAGVDPSFSLPQRLKNFFVERGFFEIMNYTFVKKGDLELLNPLASDKKSLRNNLSKQLKESLEKNTHFSDYLNLDQIKIFEIDKIHGKEGEKLSLSFAIHQKGKKAKKQYGTVESQIESIIDDLKKILGKEKIDFDRNEEGIVSINLSQFLDGEGEGKDVSKDLFSLKSYGEGDSFQGISAYPHIRRDVSFWIKDKTEKELFDIFQKLPLNHLKKIFLFDRFEKEGNISYAFAFIFQSDEKTLTDGEIEKEMEKIYSSLEEVGADVR